MVVPCLLEVASSLATLPSHYFLLHILAHIRAVEAEACRVWSGLAEEPAAAVVAVGFEGEEVPCRPCPFPKGQHYSCWEQLSVVQGRDNLALFDAGPQACPTVVHGQVVLGAVVVRETAFPVVEREKTGAGAMREEEMVRWGPHGRQKVDVGVRPVPEVGSVQEPEAAKWVHRAGSCCLTWHVFARERFCHSTEQE